MRDRSGFPLERVNSNHTTVSSVNWAITFDYFPLWFEYKWTWDHNSQIVYLVDKREGWLVSHVIQIEFININTSILRPEIESFHTWLRKGREWYLLEQSVTQLCRCHSRLILLPAYRCFPFTYIHDFLMVTLELTITIYLGTFRKEKSTIC